MPIVTVLQSLRRLAVAVSLLSIFVAAPPPVGAQGVPQSPSPSASSGGSKASAETTTQKNPTAVSQPKQGVETATLEATKQSQVGKIYYADGNVDIHYENTRLRADHVEYNDDTQVVIARGNVQLDYLTQHDLGIVVVFDM